MEIAVLVDGAFYLKRARALFGDKSPKDRASELMQYCNRHINEKETGNKLYRIFFYDCPPSAKNVYHPLSKKNVSLRKSSLFAWATEFQSELTTKRKLALRRGELLESSAGYILNPEIVKKLCDGSLRIEDLHENDFSLDIQQKGVDMRIGLDIASIAYKQQAKQIILIAGDSDFVPAAKHARREGIDFILDPMWNPIKPSLHEHIDGLTSCVSKPPNNINDPLYAIRE
ncbi:MAG: NYN domain-containing protein [Clostridia bacterium]|nr:NYN domain-containing protein [Clostridia bacterium]